MTGVGSRLGHRSRVVKLGTELVYHGMLCLLVQHRSSANYAQPQSVVSCVLSTRLMQDTLHVNHQRVDETATS